MCRDRWRLPARVAALAAPCVVAAAAGGVVVGRALLLLMVVFRLLVLFWLRGASMPMPGQLLLASFLGLLLVVVHHGMLYL